MRTEYMEFGPKDSLYTILVLAGTVHNPYILGMTCEKSPIAK